MERQRNCIICKSHNKWPQMKYCSWECIKRAHRLQVKKSHDKNSKTNKRVQGDS